LLPVLRPSLVQGRGRLVHHGWSKVPQPPAAVDPLGAGNRSGVLHLRNAPRVVVSQTGSG